jgi:hypothetical protein
MLCKFCKYWIRRKDEKFGDCDSPKFQYYCPCGNISVENDNLIYWDSEMYSADCLTGEDFGCIHWEPIQKPIPELCEICGTNKQTGSVGKIDDSSYIQYVCPDCYHNVLKMRPVGEGFLDGFSQYLKSKSTDEIMKENNIPNMLKGRKLHLNLDQTSCHENPYKDII